jgi:hypothetical protein
MDIKLETTGGWPVRIDRRARKTTLGDGYSSVTAYARVIISGQDAWDYTRKNYMNDRLKRDNGAVYMPENMRTWAGLGSEVSISSGTTTGRGADYHIDFSFSLTKRGRGHAKFAKQFAETLTALDRAGTLQEISKQAVLDEIARIEQKESDEAKAMKVSAVASYLASMVREKADVLVRYHERKVALRTERNNRASELLTDDLFEQAADEQGLDIGELRTKVAEAFSKLDRYVLIGG